MGAKTPSPPVAKPQPPPSSTPPRPIHRRPPPSRRSRYPDVVVQRNRNRNALKDLADEPRHSCLHDADTDVRRTRTTPTMPSCASLLRLHYRNRPPHRSCSRYAVVRRLGSASPPPTDGHRTTITTWPWVRPRLHRPPQLLVSSEPQEDRWKNRRRTQHCQQKEVLLFPYSCKSYVSAHTVFIP